MPDTAPEDLPPTVFVLFGATGDLARRMVLPAFFQLAQEGLLPDEWRLVGCSRGDVPSGDFADRVHDALVEFGPHPDEGPWEEFRSRLRSAGGGFAEDVEQAAGVGLLEAAAGEAQHVERLGGLLAEEVVDPVDLLLRQHRQDQLVQFAERLR